MQGPFKNGEESARAMKIATEAVRGPASIKVQKMHDAFAKHAASYDSDPEKWESLRQNSLSHAKGGKFEENLAIAIEIGAIVNTPTQP